MSNNYDEYKMRTPPQFLEEIDEAYIDCAICFDPVSVDEITEVEFRGKNVQCCGFCKNEVLNGNIK